MSLLTPLLLLISSLALASPLLPRAVPAFAFDGDAPFTVNADGLAASLTCPNGNPTTKSPPVLLVHGTATTGQETWADGYVPALKANGYTACYITIPNRSMGDMQVNAEYVAYNLHYLSSLSGGLPVAVIAHSQGNPNVQWSLQFWPSTRKVTRAFVALAPDFNGINLFDSALSEVCKTGLCQPALWQQSAGSQYYKALHATRFTAQVSTTSIWTKYDGIVTPSSRNAQLPGATVISIQDLCPLRPTIHTTMTVSSAAYSLALDALNNNGIASLSRVRKDVFSICLRVSAKNMKSSVADDLTSLFDNLVKGFIQGARVKSEPAVKAYALS
ncbi:unnamed protein product [Zymoseptoria tritici ST99CH_1A5]|uniref:AB hydrolase-1 domain-containing protein n=3 Tax=Zymoseptoria tritici TaxID=1047171 RepID=A0A1X7S5A6_ZYMT9|nr:unnamed protein product [Zymoseptoria tritici ST99CH_3D7]SMR59288.1 unnamed protein product [Zymoseptoria tritici ST99CH_1E4]SMY28497.1 unnamed protein product [Zymoseptoria tritici ST99CH_1A5]SMY28506.1 unnamed protein product [Zymoseptoria tritici ST99CH_1A5]